MATAVFVRSLRKAAARKIDALFRRSPDVRVRRRANMIRLSALGYGASEIARIENVSLQTVLTWIRRFEAGGPSALEDRPRAGRPARADGAYLAAMEKAVLTDPRDLGYPFSTWSLSRLAVHLGRKTGVMISPGHLSRLLKSRQMVFRRPKHDLSHKRSQPEYDLKREILAFLKKNS